MNTDLPSALADLDAALSDLDRSTTSLRARRPPPPLDAARLVRELRQRHGPRPTQGGDADEAPPKRPVLPLLSPSEVLKHWNAGGRAWLDDCSRLDLRAALVAAKDVEVGPRLLRDASFWPTLRTRLRDRQADQVLNAAFFLAPELPWIEPEIRFRTQTDPDRVPLWWRTPGPVRRSLAGRIATDAEAESYAAILADLGLPDVLTDAFLTEVVRASLATSSRELAAQIRFLDRGKEMGNGALIHASTREWARRAVKIGERFSAERIGIAELLRGRIGEVVSPAHDTRWVGLEAERKIVRSWLVGEIFRVLFSHLVPENEHRSQTEPRRLFWAKYDQSVRMIWLLVSREHRARLDGDEAVAKLRLHGLLEVRDFTGQDEQDGLWMLLGTPDGGTISVFEGNANTPVRIANCELRPVLNGVIDYRDVRAVFGEGHGDGEWKRRHIGRWADDTERALAILGVAAGRP